MRQSVLFFESRGAAIWCREHRRYCIPTAMAHRPAFLMVMPRD